MYRMLFSDLLSQLSRAHASTLFCVAFPHVFIFRTTFPAVGSTRKCARETTSCPVLALQLQYKHSFQITVRARSASSAVSAAEQSPTAYSLYFFLHFQEGNLSAIQTK